MFQPVLDCFKVVHCFTNPVRLATQESANTDRSQNIFDVMPALQRDLGDQHDLFLATVIAEEDAAVVDERSLRFTSLVRLNQKTCARVRDANSTQGQVIGVECRVIFRSLLIFKDARFFASV